MTLTALAAYFLATKASLVRELRATQSLRSADAETIRDLRQQVRDRTAEREAARDTAARLLSLTEVEQRLMDETGEQT